MIYSMKGKDSLLNDALHYPVREGSFLKWVLELIGGPLRLKLMTRRDVVLYISLASVIYTNTQIY